MTEKHLFKFKTPKLIQCCLIFAILILESRFSSCEVNGDW